jgi:hypothetical protein
MRNAWIGMETVKIGHCLACYQGRRYPDFAWKDGYAEDDDGHRSLIARGGQAKRRLPGAKLLAVRLL